MRQSILFQQTSIVMMSNQSASKRSLTSSTVTSEEQLSDSKSKKARQSRSQGSFPALIESSQRDDVRSKEESDAKLSKAQSLIDLRKISEDDTRFPSAVDISSADAATHEIRELVTHLCIMFPETHPSFFCEQADQLVGKPVALDRFIDDHLARGGQVPEDWLPKELLNDAENYPLLSLDPELPPENFGDYGDYPFRDGGQVSKILSDGEEDVQQRLSDLISIFPNSDPEFLRNKILELYDKKEEMEQWINEMLENKASKLPTRKEYEERKKHSELLEKYSSQVSVQEILNLYDNDPESYFMNPSRKVTKLYKRHAFIQLEKEFRNISLNTIYKIFSQNRGLYLPTHRLLKLYSGKKRKRTICEVPLPTDVDINFLKELQYSRMEERVRNYLSILDHERQQKIKYARQNNLLKLCDCCMNDECLEDDLLSCPRGHLYCKECIQRASSVAIGEGKTELKCLMHCDQPFSLSTLQTALSANTFSKWLEKIQLAEIEKAKIDGLEQCPFCPFATIIDRPKKDFKVLTCLNPNCGIESCRLCREISHVPFRCEEIEKDAEVKKRTFIENKMAEALIRTCYNCQRPYVKQDGCNKITCPNCKASMCYICRKPVTDYQHFAGQGMEHLKGKCPLWFDSKLIHERDVALSALEAKEEAEKTQPQVILKHDPTEGLNFEQVKNASHSGDNRKETEFPPDLEEFLPQDPLARQRLIEQQRIGLQRLADGNHNQI